MHVTEQPLVRSGLNQKAIFFRLPGAQGNSQCINNETCQTHDNSITSKSAIGNKTFKDQRTSWWSRGLETSCSDCQVSRKSFFSPLIIYNTLKKKPQKTLKSDNAAQQRFKVPAKANQTLCPSVRSQKVLAKTKGGFYFEATLVYFFLPRLV